jgi:hypothetical protein
VPGLNPAHGLWRVGETGPHAVAQWHAAHGQSRPNPVVLTARDAGATLWVRSRVGRGLAYHGVEGTRRWEGCAGQGGKWRGSPRGSGVGGVAERDRRDDILMAEGGWIAASDAPCYPMVLRTGGRSEAEPKWGGWGGESTTVALTSEKGRRWWHG